MERVLLALPRHTGQVEDESRLSAYLSTQRTDWQITIDSNVNSALCLNFNAMWCRFLNEGYEWFAMLHSDVYAQGPWMDILRDSLERRGAAVASGVSAIKDSRRLTSTAIGNPKDPWQPSRRITVFELKNLPAEFTNDECSHLLYRSEHRCLLGNTGCMLVKRGDWVNDFPGFNTQNRIVLCPVTKKRIAQFEPEDWNLHRYLANNGLGAVVTQQVRIDHYGRYSYDNYTVGTGWVYDEEAKEQM